MKWILTHEECAFRPSGNQGLANIIPGTVKLIFQIRKNECQLPTRKPTGHRPAHIRPRQGVRTIADLRMLTPQYRAPYNWK